MRRPERPTGRSGRQGRAAVLLDLDGTLTDPFPGISACIRHALGRQNLPDPGDDVLRSWVGPPLQDSFTAYCASLGRGDPAGMLVDYRARFDRDGWRENRVYDGIPEMLETLVGRGHELQLTTSKPAVFARRIVDHFGLSPWLRAVYGSELDGRRGDKRELLAWQVSRAGLDPGRCVLVGDRRHDVRAALSQDMTAIGVLWGFGSPDELADAGTHQMVESPAELANVLGNAR